MYDRSCNLVSLRQQATTTYNEMRESMEKSLEEKKGTYETIDGIKIISAFLNGNQSNQVIDYADSNGVDLTAIRSKGLQGLSKVVMIGSNSRNVSRNVSCHILIVKDEIPLLLIT